MYVESYFGTRRAIYRCAYATLALDNIVVLMDRGTVLRLGGVLVEDNDIVRSDLAWT